MESKRPSYTRPWFWLLVVLIFSVFFKLIPKEESLPAQTLPESYVPSENITEASDDETDTAEQTEVQTKSAVTEKYHFILNTAAKKFHITECSGVKKLSESKRSDTDIEAASMEEAISILENEGYELCGICAKKVKK